MPSEAAELAEETPSYNAQGRNRRRGRVAPMTAAPIDFVARRSEIGTRDQQSPEEKAAIRDLLVLRSRWLDEITFDARLTDAEQRIASGAVNRYLNRDPKHGRFGMFWPAAGTLAKDLGKAERTVWRALQRSCTFGYIEIVEVGGGSKSAVYRLKMPGPSAAPCEATLPPAAPSAVPFEATLPPAAPNPASSGTRPCRQRQQTLREDLEGGPPHTEPLGTPSGARVYSPIDVAFEDFWLAFPHRPADPKRVARGVFVKIVNSGVDPGLLIERAQAHATNIEGLDPRYWTTAHKWLHEECWADQTVHPIHSQGVVAAAQAVLDGGPPLRRKPEVSDTEWRAMLKEFATTNRLSGTWLAMFPGRGLSPQNAATRVPMHLREEFGFA